MSTAESRKEILNLLATGKISADEAADLLSQARTAPDPAPVNPEAPAEKAPAPAVAEAEAPAGQSDKKPAWFRVRVSNLDTGKSKVSVNIPLRMLKFGFSIASRFTPDLEELDWNDVNRMIDENAVGMLVDVQNEEDNEHVQVYID